MDVLWLSWRFVKRQQKNFGDALGASQGVFVVAIPATWVIAFLLLRGIESGGVIK